MTIEEANVLLANFLDFKLKTDNKTWEISNEASQILKCKTTQFVKFNENFELLMLVVKKCASIKDFFITTTYGDGKVEVVVCYKYQIVEGEPKNSKFSVSREKPVDKYKQAIYECITTFVGWLEDNKECYSEIYWELNHIDQNNIQYLAPKEITCPHCKNTFELEGMKPIELKEE